MPAPPAHTAGIITRFSHFISQIIQNQTKLFLRHPLAGIYCVLDFTYPATWLWNLCRRHLRPTANDFLRRRNTDSAFLGVLPRRRISNLGGRVRHFARRASSPSVAGLVMLAGEVLLFLRLVFVPALFALMCAAPNVRINGGAATLRTGSGGEMLGDC
jgi:hypothetical protein